MSKQNKVNPGTYTQKGRLTPDDTAREVKKQREAATPARVDGTPHPHARPGRSGEAAPRDQHDEQSAKERSDARERDREDG